MSPDSPRVRFAPSPTGFLHVGGARTALYNWLFARQSGGVFVLRIEDTDRDRSSDEMTQAILDGMTWLGLDWDEGPYHQADGFERHRADVGGLVEAALAYRCFCTAEDLRARREAAEAAHGQGAYRYDRRCAMLPRDEVDRRVAAGEPHSVRFQVPEGDTAWDDLVHGETRFQNAEIDDFIILRTDGTPTYNLAVVSDDIEMRITHVLRGDDHLSNTPKQILLYRALGASEPRFAHLPMILGPDGKRLSKRHGATAVGEYRALGILPQALNNFLALLGWSPGNDQEVMQEAELIALFSTDRILKKSSVFDPEKLEWMNGQHIQLLTPDAIVALIAPQLIDEGLTTARDLEDRAGWFADVAEVIRTRARTVGTLAEQARLFLAPAVEYDAQAVAKGWKDAAEASDRLRLAHRTLDDLDNWDPDAIEAALRDAAEQAEIGFGKLVQPLRVALTGTMASPGIDNVVWLLGKSAAGERIEAALRFLASTDEHRDSVIDTVSGGS